MSYKTNLKKACCVSVAVALMIFAFCACSNQNNENSKNDDFEIYTPNEEKIMSSDSLATSTDNPESSKTPSNDNFSTQPAVSYGYFEGKFANVISVLPGIGETVTYDPTFCCIMTESGDVLRFVSATREEDFLNFIAQDCPFFTDEYISCEIVSATGELFVQLNKDVLPDGTVIFVSERYTINTQEQLQYSIEDIKECVKDAYVETESYFLYHGNSYLLDGTLDGSLYFNPYESDEIE